MMLVFKKDRYYNYGPFIKYHREKCKLSQLDVAELVGSNRQTIHRIEAGRQILDFEMAVRLSKELGFSLEKLSKVEIK